MEKRPGKTTELDPKELEQLFAQKDSPEALRTYGSSRNLIRFDDSYWEIAGALRKFTPQARMEWLSNFVEYALRHNNHEFLAKAEMIFEELVRMQLPVLLRDNLHEWYEKMMSKQENYENFDPFSVF